MATSRHKISVLRGILRELRYLNHQAPLRDSPSVVYLLDQYRKYQVTSEKICRGPEEMQHMAENYYCLLHSTRVQQETVALYKGAGERSVEESARLVGLRLPKTPDGQT